MPPSLLVALAEAEPLFAERGWIRPTGAALAEASRLLGLVAIYRAPSLHVEPEGVLVFEWEAAGHGWLTLAVNGLGQLTHSAVIDEDEFAQTEIFGESLPDWAAELLARLMRRGH